MMKKLNKQLMKEHGGEIIPFKSLTMPYKLAIAWYMAVDGEAWELPFEAFYLMKENQLKKSIIKNINIFDKKYGRKKFGVMNIPIEICKHHIMTAVDFDGRSLNDSYTSFADYHTWYMKGIGVEKHTKKNAFPCILSDFDDEFLQDGWHRFHRYVQLKMSSIPCVCYV